jgi:hypothetical protein
LDKAVGAHVSPLRFDILEAIRAGIHVVRRFPAGRNGNLGGPQAVLPFGIHQDQVQGVRVLKWIRHGNLIPLARSSLSSALAVARAMTDGSLLGLRNRIYPAHLSNFPCFSARRRTGGQPAAFVIRRAVHTCTRIGECAY